MTKKNTRYLPLIIISLAILTTSYLSATSFPITHYDYYRVSNSISPAVAATGGINLTNTEFPNTSYYNPALLAFRKQTTISANLSFHNEDKTPLTANGLPTDKSLQWCTNNPSYIGIEAENVSFNYFKLAHINFETEEPGEYKNYLDYYLDGYRFSYANASKQLAFGLNFNFLTGRAVYLSEIIESNDNKVDQFIDDKAYGYSVDFGAVVKSQYLSYGIYIPNMLSKINWADNENANLQRRFNAGIQWGSDRSFVSSGFSRWFDFKSSNTYHFGLQHNIKVDLVGDAYYEIPVRFGTYSKESFWKFKELRYGFGTGFRYSYFFIDVSMTTIDPHWKNYFILTSISMSLER